MTITEQLNYLARQFPNSKELAISVDMALQYEAVIVYMERYVKGFASADFPLAGYSPDPELLRTLDGHTIEISPIPLLFKDRSLTIVEVA